MFQLCRQIKIINKTQYIKSFHFASLVPYNYKFYADKLRLGSPEKSFNISLLKSLELVPNYSERSTYLETNIYLEYLIFAQIDLQKCVHWHQRIYFATKFSCHSICKPPFDKICMLSLFFPINFPFRWNVFRRGRANISVGPLEVTYGICLYLCYFFRLTQLLICLR